MKYLLDTHAFLWAIAEPSRLSRRATKVVLNEENDLLLSAASIWEIVLKVESGKLRLPATAEYFDAHMSRLGIGSVLPVTPVHVYAITKLPAAHRDPFDRLLAAQCRVEELTLLSADKAFRGYPIKVVW
jgi:PIN domain nuclease of toxin-antitoxin system